MKKSNLAKRLAIGSMAAVLSMGVLAGCAPEDGKTFDNETDALTFSIQDVDRVFNPFFSATGPDGEVVGMTQLGMLGNDKEGKPVYGDDEAVIVKDMEISTTGASGSEDQRTTYKFVLKNNIKFSDGVPLTMKDVLFNLYVYLDPAYYGSSTIYSTEIVGLNEYRTQEENEQEQEHATDRFKVAAESRIDALKTAAEDIIDELGDTMDEQAFKGQLEDYARKSGSYFDNIVDDFSKTCEYFREELHTDFSNSRDSYSDLKLYDSSKREYANLFTNNVQVFFYNEGYIQWDRDAAQLRYSFGNIADNDLSSINMSDEEAIQMVYEDVIPSKLVDVLEYWGTATTVSDYLVSKEAQDYYATHERRYENISGIVFANKDEAVTVKSDKTGESTVYQKVEYNEDGSPKEGFYEVLSITIKKVDPKAIWNFAFGVAPMHYYSDAEHISKFDYEANFGVDYYNVDWLRNVVNGENKVGVPVGAGPYAASKASGGLENIQAGDFLNGNIIYYERNPYYNMGEGPDGTARIKKIRYQVVSAANTLLNSLYVGEIDYVTPNAKPENVEELQDHEASGEKLSHAEITTNGYGYIGINAGKVPSIKVRQAIMHSINVGEVVAYYGTSADIIYRSISKMSWAYPQGVGAYYPYVGDPIPVNLSAVNPDYAEFVTSHGYTSGQVMDRADQVAFIRGLVEDAGYTIGGDGVYVDNRGNKLEYKFTVVGSEQDHPAYNPLFQAQLFLNTEVKGFSIDTVTDSRGLSKLSTGDLAIWAAAWSSTIDPDMYQVYHKESQATSVKAWGYPEILRNTGNRYAVENELLDRLSELIEQGREINAESERAVIYKEALDLVMQLAIELPTYQRSDLFAWNSEKLDSSTLLPLSECSAFRGLTSELQNVSLCVK